MVIQRTRSAHLEKGLEYALGDAPRSGAPPEYRTEDKVAVVALACQSSLPGAKRGTVRLLACEAAELATNVCISPRSVGCGCGALSC